MHHFSACTRVSLSDPPILANECWHAVSKQVIIPNAPGQLNEAGEPEGEHASGCVKQMDGMLEQLRWWAEACRTQRNK
jgi:hypothetical protein|eukprot:COSAG06_NODE_20866_length_778_cov_1.235641_2_plen_78_part_00